MNGPPIWWLFSNVGGIWLSWASFDAEFKDNWYTFYGYKFPFKFIMQSSKMVNNLASKSAVYFLKKRQLTSIMRYNTFFVFFACLFLRLFLNSSVIMAEVCANYGCLADYVPDNDVNATSNVNYTTIVVQVCCYKYAYFMVSG